MILSVAGDVIAQCPSTNLFGSGVQFGDQTALAVEIGDYNVDGIQDVLTSSWKTLSTADLNADGIVDVVGRAFVVRVGAGIDGHGVGSFQAPVGVGPLQSEAISVYLGRGLGMPIDSLFQAPLHYPVLTTCSGALEVADINSDGIDDLLLATSCAANVDSSMFRVLIAGGTNGQWDQTFSPPQEYGNTIPGEESDVGVSDIETLDVDGDGILDVVVITNFYLYVFPGNGSVGVADGTFGSPVQFSYGCCTGNSIVVDDFKEDGFADLAISVENGVSVMFGTGAMEIGPNAFTSPLLFLAQSQTSGDVLSVDVNHDSIVDLIQAASSDVVVYVGQGINGIGVGTFEPSNRYGSASNARGLAVGDFNEDGRPDIAEGSLRVLFGLCPDPVLSAPQLVAITDVRNDQGGRVSVRWNRSSLDVMGNRAVTGYTVWRRIEATQRERTVNSRRIVERRFAGTPTFWEALDTIPAHFLEGYGYTAATTQDSMPGSNPYTAFFVSAVTADPFVFFDSAVDSGYSVDNLAPFKPTGLMGEFIGDDLTIHWNPNLEQDLSHYALYRGPDAFFEPDPGNRIASLGDTTYVDTQFVNPSVYKLSAIDIHGNESPFALLEPDVPVPVEVSDLAGTASAAAILLSWRLSADALREVRLVEVQRAPAAAGPWVPIGTLWPSAAMQFEDTGGISQGAAHWYRLALEAQDGSRTLSRPIEVSTAGLRWRTALEAPYAAPGGHIEIRYSIGAAGPVRLEVFDVAGRRVRTLVTRIGVPGSYRETWDRVNSAGNRVASGIYVVRLEDDAATASRKVTVVQ